VAIPAVGGIGALCWWHKRAIALKRIVVTEGEVGASLRTA